MGRCQERTGRLKGLESSLAPSAWALSSLPSSAGEGTKEGRATPPRTVNGKPSPSSSSTSSSSSCSGPSSPSPSSRRATTHATGTTPKGWKKKEEPAEKVTLRDKSPKTRGLILLKMKAPLLVRSRRIRARSRASKASFLSFLPPPPLSLFFSFQSTVGWRIYSTKSAVIQPEAIRFEGPPFSRGGGGGSRPSLPHTVHSRICL